MNSIEILNLFNKKNIDFAWQTEIQIYKGCSYTADRISACKVNEIVLSENQFESNDFNLQIIENHFIKGQRIGTLKMEKFITKDLKERVHISINDYLFETKLLNRLAKINRDCEVYQAKHSSSCLIFDYKDFEVLLMKTLSKDSCLNFVLDN